MQTNKTSNHKQWEVAKNNNAVFFKSLGVIRFLYQNNSLELFLIKQNFEDRNTANKGGFINK